MNAIEIKKELHDYIEVADERLLSLLYGMIIVDKQSSYNIPDWHQTIIEERSEAYNRNPESAISWEELKSKIENMK